MTVSASIDLQFEYENSKQTKSNHLLKCLQEYGWTLKDNGQMTFLPVEDNGEYDWTSEEIDESKIYKILDLKENNGEVIGLVLTWKESGIGGELLIFDNSNLSFCITINRKKYELEGLLEITDFNWYLDKLLVPMKNNHYNVYSINCSEHM